MEGAGMRCESPVRPVHLWRHFSCVQDGIFIVHLCWCKLLILLMFIEKTPPMNRYLHGVRRECRGRITFMRRWMHFATDIEWELVENACADEMQQ